MFQCWASKLPPLENSVQSSFMTCLLNCKTKNDTSSCVADCAMKQPCNSEECQTCIEGCANIVNPEHNLQCNLGCYRHKRINPYTDFKDTATSDCENFHFFYSEFKVENPEVTETEIRTSIETVCSEDIDALPVCHAIAKNTWYQTIEYLNNNNNPEDFCRKMGFIYNT